MTAGAAPPAIGTPRPATSGGSSTGPLTASGRSTVLAIHHSLSALERGPRCPAATSQELRKCKRSRCRCSIGAKRFSPVFSCQAPSRTCHSKLPSYKCTTLKPPLVKVHIIKNTPDKSAHHKQQPSHERASLKAPLLRPAHLPAATAPGLLAAVLLVRRGRRRLRSQREHLAARGSSAIMERV